MFTKYHKFPTISWVQLTSLQQAVWFSLLLLTDFSFSSLNVTSPVFSQHSHQVLNAIALLLLDLYCPAQATTQLMWFGWGKPLNLSPTSNVVSQNMWYMLFMMKSDSACTRKEILYWHSCGEDDGLELFSEVIWEAGPDSLVSTLLCMA